MARYDGAPVTDADREVAAGRLREQYAAGGMSLDEFQERLDGIYKAQTARELNMAADSQLYAGQVLNPGTSWGSYLDGDPFGATDVQATMARVARRLKLALGVLAAGGLAFAALLVVAVLHGGLLGVAAGILLAIFVIGVAVVGTAAWLARRLWRRQAWAEAAPLAAGQPWLTRLLRAARVLLTSRALWRLRSRLTSRG